MSYDKTTKRVVVSGLGQVRYLRRSASNQLDGAVFNGTWRFLDLHLADAPSKRLVFRVDDEGCGSFKFTSGTIEPSGDIAWGGDLPARVVNGVLVVDGRTNIKKISDNKLLYEVS
jgi:hypothetical protein